MRYFHITVSKNDKEVVTTYTGFNRRSEGSHFTLLPFGHLPDIEGCFYCDQGDLAEAVESLIDYNVDVFGRQGGVLVDTNL